MINDYYIRTTASLWPIMLAIGARLGAIELLYGDYETDDEGQQIPVGDPIIMPTLGGAWDYIGAIYEPTGEMDVDVPVVVPITNEDDEVLLHGNLRTPINLREAAMALAGEDAEIAAALESLDSFFLLDELGNARLPTNPYRVWA